MTVACEPLMALEFDARCSRQAALRVESRDPTATAMLVLAEGTAVNIKIFEPKERLENQP